MEWKDAYQIKRFVSSLSTKCALTQWTLCAQLGIVVLERCQICDSQNLATVDSIIFGCRRMIKITFILINELHQLSRLSIIKTYTYISRLTQVDLVLNIVAPTMHVCTVCVKDRTLPYRYNFRWCTEILDAMTHYNACRIWKNIFSQFS